MSDISELKAGIGNTINHMADCMNADAVKRWSGFLKTIDDLEYIACYVSQDECDCFEADGTKSVCMSCLAKSLGPYAE